jgi:hypothetical protein
MDPATLEGMSSSGLHSEPPKRYSHVLILGTCECELFWKKGLYRYD